MAGENPQALHPYFNIAQVGWYSAINQNQMQPSNVPLMFDIRSVIAPAAYGPTGNDPPGIVWVDCCDSAGTGSDNFDFATAFSSGNLFGVFIGWNGTSEAYGAYAAPNDDWTFWRRQMWSQLLSMSNNYQTAFDKTVRDYRVHGYHFPYTATPEYRARITGAGWDSF